MQKPIVDDPNEDDDDCFIPETQQIIDEPSDEGINISSQIINENYHDPSQDLLVSHHDSMVIPRVVHSPINLNLNFTSDSELNDSVSVQREMSVTPDLDYQGNQVKNTSKETSVTPDLDHEGNALEDPSKQSVSHSPHLDENITEPANSSQGSNKENDTSPTQKFQKASNKSDLKERESVANISQGSNKENDNSLTQKFQNPINNPNTPESTQLFRQRIVSTQNAFKAPETQGLEQTMAFEKRDSLAVTESTQEFRRRIVSTQVIRDQEEDEDADTSLNTQAFKARHSSTIVPDNDTNEVEEATQVATKTAVILAPDSDEDEVISPTKNKSRRNAILDSTDDEDNEVVQHLTKTQFSKGEFIFFFYHPVLDFLLRMILECFI